MGRARLPSVFGLGWAGLGWAGSADYQPQPEPPATSLGVLIDPALTLPEQLAQPLWLADKPGGALQTYSAGDLAYLELTMSKPDC